MTGTSRESCPVSHSFLTLSSMKLSELGLDLERVRCPPPARVAAIRTDLATHGQLTPLVAQAQRDGQPQLLDGFKRLRAARDLGWATLEVGCVDVKASTALALMLSLNRRFGLSQIEEALVVRELTSSGLTGVEVGVLLGRHKSWVSRRIGLLERLAPELLQDMKLGLLEPGMARRLLGLPRGNQVELATVARRAGLGVRQTESLVSLWRRAPSEEARKYVLTNPIDAIRAKTSAPKCPEDPRLSAQGQWVQRRLRAAAKALSGLTESLGSGLQPADRKLLTGEIDVVIRQTEMLGCRLGRNEDNAS